MTVRATLFCEDAAHESWARALVGQIGANEETEVSLSVGSARFGVGRLKKELRAFDRLLEATGGRPDLLVVLIDANTVGDQARRQEISEAISSEDYPALVVGVPDPAIETWYLADPEGFHKTFGVTPNANLEPKASLVDALERAGEVVLSGGEEFAEEIVGGMRLYQAGRRERSLKRFIDELRAALRQLSAT